ncbi:amino acid deaminase [Cryptosporangium sp. NPDC048952]|uniref:amino acid deaminase n=1 Tax=Cryptosporangium sp. NPDC048952 TaxID=3363961 RepID=UPI0037229869
MRADAFLAELAGRRLDGTYKSLPIPSGSAISAGEIGEQGWNVRSGDLDFPVLVIKHSALTTNIGLMADYCRDNGLLLAPHGKTTMAPQLFARQFAAGAWGLTAATPAQCRAYRVFGVSRILLANELVDPGSLRWAAAELAADPGFDLLCNVDSDAGVDAVEDVFAAMDRPLGVLLELGYPGGRTGCRTIEEAVALAERVVASPWLELRGVTGFEGLMPGHDVDDVMTKCTVYLRRIRELVEVLDSRGLLPADEIVVSCGGSSYFDLVAAELGPARFTRPVLTVLRSGCYLAHDVEMYEKTSPFGARGTGPRLEPALEVWATVWSRPEPDLAIVGFGKRDAPYDYALPVAESVYARGSDVARGVAYQVTALNDQHAFVRVPTGDPLAVGDRVVFGISHPCTAFDKWRYLPMVDERYDVVDGVFTFF